MGKTKKKNPTYFRIIYTHLKPQIMPKACVRADVCTHGCHAGVGGCCLGGRLMRAEMHPPPANEALAQSCPFLCLKNKNKKKGDPEGHLREPLPRLGGLRKRLPGDGHPQEEARGRAGAADGSLPTRPLLVSRDHEINNEINHGQLGTFGKYAHKTYVHGSCTRVISPSRRNSGELVHALWLSARVGGFRPVIRLGENGRQ